MLHELSHVEDRLEDSEWDILVVVDCFGKILNDVVFVFVGKHVPETREGHIVELACQWLVDLGQGVAGTEDQTGRLFEKFHGGVSKPFDPFVF